jgi:hypothetical protein
LCWTKSFLESVLADEAGVVPADFFFDPSLVGFGEHGCLDDGL